jgi:hypothetical protein
MEKRANAWPQVLAEGQFIDVEELIDSRKFTTGRREAI